MTAVSVWVPEAGSINWRTDSSSSPDMRIRHVAIKEFEGYIAAFLTKKIPEIS
jgi:hypothetical protein